MPEGAPRFESFESSRSLERGRSEIEPQPTGCQVRIKIRQWPDYGSSKLFREGLYVSVHMRCDTCPAVKMDETLHADFTDKDGTPAKIKLRQDAAIVFLNGCKELTELERLDSSNIPQELR